MNIKYLERFLEKMTIEVLCSLIIIIIIIAMYYQLIDY